MYDSEEYITEARLKNSSAKIFPINTVLIALIGATIGDVGILAKEGSVNQNVGAFLPFEKIIPKFLYWYFRNFAEEIRKQQKQGVQPSLNLGDLKKLQIPLPTLESQRQIVEKIDHHMQALEGVRLLKEEAQKRIEEILAKVWRD